jgi:hypothetical protein
MGVLKAHMDAVEEALLATSRIPANAGHLLHRGTPREAFISKFLRDHLSERLAIGTGEIINASSAPRAPRNQFDIVVYKSDYPKLDLGGGISAFLAESVVATIEVKSLLTEIELDRAIESAANAKRLKRSFKSGIFSGYIPPGILSFVVSYAGPADINTVHGWLIRSEARLSLNQTRIPTTGQERRSILSDSLEGIFCLGLGTIFFDNSPVSFMTDEFRSANPDAKRMVISAPQGNLLFLFLLLTEAGANLSWLWPNLSPYLQDINFMWQPRS